MTKIRFILLWCAAFLIADAALIVPLATASWGYLGDIPLLIVTVAALADQVVFLAAWSALCLERWWQSISSFLLMLLGIWVTEVLDRNYGLVELIPVLLPTAMVSFACFTLLRVRGWRIAPVATNDTVQRSSPRWQFTLRDAFWATLAIAVYLGLGRWMKNLTSEWLNLLVTVVPFCASITASFIDGLMARRAWHAVLTAVIVVPLIVVLVLLPTHPNNPVIVGSASFIAGCFLVPMILILRWCGFRLVKPPPVGRPEMIQ